MMTSETTTFVLRNSARSIPGVDLANGAVQLLTIVGLTSSRQSMAAELEKVRVAQRYGASMIADVSTTSQSPDLHQAILGETELPLSSVPLYEIFQRASRDNCWNSQLSRQLVLEVIEAQAERGVDCMTLHASYPRSLLPMVNASCRRIKIQGRGGGLIHQLLQSTELENPLFEYYDDILAILSKHHVAVSLGNCLRTGTVDDPPDDLLDSEMKIWSDLALRARKASVGVMVEGGSHLRIDEIGPHIRRISQACGSAPVRMLGPVATEKGLGYDHITGAISAVEAIRSGAQLITVVTRAEHIGLPNADELREALIGFRIARELANQPRHPRDPDTSFTCGLGFDALPASEFFDLGRAVALKAAKNEGNLNACSMCNQSCRMRLQPRSK